MKKSQIISVLIAAFLCVTAYAAEDKTPKNIASAEKSEAAVEVPELSDDAKNLLDQVKQRVSNINTQELQALLKARQDTVVIDVRNPDEINLQGGYIRADNIFNVSRGQLEFNIGLYVQDKNTPVVVYDGFNQRSPLAAEALGKLGYTQEAGRPAGQVQGYGAGFIPVPQAG
jgi:rhodanese-related sulfurtransferase